MEILWRLAIRLRRVVALDKLKSSRFPRHAFIKLDTSKVAALSLIFNRSSAVRISGASMMFFGTSRVTKSEDPVPEVCRGL